MRSRSRIAAVGVAAIAALAVAGCGGGSGGGASSTAPSAADFRAQADAICTTAKAEIDALGTPSSAADLKAFFPKALATNATQLAALRKLTPPAELEAEWTSAIGLLDKQQGLLDGAAKRIAGGEDPVAVITDVQDEIDPIDATLTTKAKDLGLTVCGSDDNSSGSTTTDTTAGAKTGTAEGFASNQVAFGTALQNWGTKVSNVNSGSDIADNLTALRADTNQAEDALDEMAGYTLADAALERRRATTVSKGRELVTLMRELEDEGPTNSDAEMQDLVGRFQRAAQGFKEIVGS